MTGVVASRNTLHYCQQLLTFTYLQLIFVVTAAGTRPEDGRHRYGPADDDAAPPPGP